MVTASVRARVVLLAASAVIAYALLAVTVLLMHRHVLSSRRALQLIGNYQTLVRTALIHESPEHVAQVLKDSGSADVRLVQAPRNPSSEPPLDPILEGGMQTLRSRYGNDAVRLCEEETVSLCVRVSDSPAGAGWWIAIPVNRSGWDLSTELMIELAVVLAGTVLVTAFFSGTLVRPLHALSRAVSEIGRGRWVQVERKGPLEVEALVDKFNEMSAALARNQRDRRILLAGFPHDLRAPLTRMRLRLALMEDSLLPEDRDSLQQDMADLEHITAQLLDYMREVEEGTPTPAPEIFPLNEWAQARVHHWQGLGYDVQYCEPADPILVRAEPTSLQRVLDNLIDNAFTHGAAPVRVVLDSRDQEVVMTVYDNGPGIPVAQREDAMRPFERLDGARTRTGNCGLGLAIVEQIARRHRGAVELGEAKGGGLSVSVRLGIVST
jgi:signal transduction histidine kinase